MNGDAPFTLLCMCFYSGGAFASGTKKFSLPAYRGIDVRAYAFCSLSFSVFYAKTKKRKRTGVISLPDADI